MNMPVTGKIIREFHAYQAFIGETLLVAEYVLYGVEKHHIA